MAVELATAYVALAVETRGVARQTQEAFVPAEKQAEAAGKRAGGRFSGGMKKSFAGIAGLFAGAMAGIGVKDFIGDSIAEARESQKVGALTTSIIKSTGGAAKVTAQQVGDLATAISQKTGRDDEAIQTGANLLLTFKNVRNEVGKGNDMFNQATAAAVDLSAAGFGSVDGAAKMLGKALNDPIKGISALGRAGVTFTDQQKEQIKTLVKSGDVLGAQKIIMKEVQSQVGGAAAATATAGEKAKVTFDNLKESAGTYLLPIVDKLANGFVDLVQQFQAGEGTGGRIRDILGQIGSVASFLGDHMGTLKVVVEGLVAAWVAWRLAAIIFNVTQMASLVLLKAQTVGTLENAVASKTAAAASRVFAAGQWLLNAAMSANPLALVVIAIAALVAAIVIAYKKNEAFRALVNKVWAGIKTAIKATVDWFRNTAWPVMRDAFQWIGDKGKWLWERVLSPTFSAIKTGVGKVKDAFRATASGIKTEWDKLEGYAKTPIKFVIETVLNRGLIGSFNWLSSKIGGPRIPNIPLPKGFAKGGVLPGYTPGRDVHSFYSPTAGRLDLSGGEAIMRPEFTRAVGGKRGIEALNRAARRGYAGGGIIDWIKRKGADAFNWVDDKTSALWRAVTNPAKFLRDRLPRIPGSDILGEYAAGARDRLVSLASSRVKSLFKTFQGAKDKAFGMGIGSNARGWQQLWSIVHGLLPGIQLTSSFRPGAITASGNQSYHSLGRAIDVAPPSMAAFNKIRNAFPNATELIYSPAGIRQLKNGRSYVYGEPVKSMHYNHIHLAMARGGVIPKPLLFDRGGVLPQGTSLVHNATGAPEPLVPADRGNVIVYMTVSVDDLAKMSQVSDFLDMLQNSRVSQRKVARSGRVAS